MKLSLAEIIKNASLIKDVQERASYLRANDSDQLRYILELGLIKWVAWELPEGAPPYKPCELVDIEGRLYQECRTLPMYLKGNRPDLNKVKREMLFIGLLESIDKEDAKLLCAVKDKKLPTTITAEVANLAFPGLIPDE